MDRLTQLTAVTILTFGSIGFSALSYATAATPDMGTPQTQPTMGSVTEANVVESDSTIQSAVQTALASYAGKVNVKVTNGIVYLTGELDSDTDYEKVISLAQAVQNVGDVNVDSLTVKDSHAPLKDTYITAKVKGALLAASIMDNRNIPASTIRVETKDGQVYLSGTVNTATDKQNVLEVVRKVKGVSQVNDQIEITGSNG